MNGERVVGEVLGACRRAGWWALRWHPWACAGLVVAASVAVVAGVGALAALVVLATAAGVVWAWGHPVSFGELVGARARASWRREVVYRRRWRPAMFLSGLACRFDGAELIPRLGRVRSSWAADVVRVQLVSGQESIDWESRTGALAQTFGAQGCRARALRPRWIELEFTFRLDIPVVAALPIPSRPDLDGLTIGRRGDGRPWRLRLRGTHVLVGGATEAGKGSVLWSIIRSLLTWTHAGVAEMRVADPKGGVELGHGALDPTTRRPSCPLFARFATTAEAIAGMLEEAVDDMLARAERLAGIARQHQPTVGDPLVVVIIDELAHLATYGDENVRERVRQALGILLSEGRALGFHVVAAVQRPSQLKPDLRRAFPTRVALRTVDADEVEMILGQEAWVRGARCERIPKTTPGCGWVLLDGDIEPTWVRASWISDTDIARMAATYPAPTPADPDVDVDGDQGEGVAA